VATLEARLKADPDGFSEEQQEDLNKKRQRISKHQSKINELQEEIQRLDEYMQELGADGRVHVEKQLFPGVVITIKDQSQEIKDNYNSVSVTYDDGYVKIGKLEKDESASRSWRNR